MISRKIQVVDRKMLGNLNCEGRTCPRKTASIVATDHVQWRIVGRATLWEDHGHQVLLLGLHVVGVVLRHFLSGLEKGHGSGIRSEMNQNHNEKYTNDFMKSISARKIEFLNCEFKM